MLAAVVPGANQNWEIRDLPTPKPSPTQVLIRIRASGVCFTDIHLAQGKIVPVSFPAVLGHEPAGEVVELGSAVTTVQVGDRVGTNTLQRGCGRCEWCQRDKELYCQNGVWLMIHQSGSHAEYMLAEADKIHLLPDALSFEQAAPLLCAGYTVWSGIREANPLPADRIAVVGLGGLGHLAVQYAKAAGHTVIAVTQSVDKRKLGIDLGADEVVRNGEQLKQAGGADVILSTANSYSVAVDVQGVAGVQNRTRSQNLGVRRSSGHCLLREQDVLTSYTFLTQRLPTSILELLQLLELLELLSFAFLAIFCGYPISGYPPGTHDYPDERFNADGNTSWDRLPRDYRVLRRDTGLGGEK